MKMKISTVMKLICFTSLTAAKTTTTTAAMTTTTTTAAASTTSTATATSTATVTAIPTVPALAPAPAPVPYSEWAGIIANGTCSEEVLGQYAYSNISCTEDDEGMTHFMFPAGIYEMDEQLLVPPYTTITGATDPNNWDHPDQSPDYSLVTLFLATKGTDDFNANYCYASDMVNTRVGFVLSSNVTVERVAFQGLDTIRPSDNGALCGGGAFETKGCALNDCSNEVNNGGSDGMGSHNVLIKDVRLNDYYYTTDGPLIGQDVPGNTDGCAYYDGCCFCKPNGVRASQVGVFVPLTRDDEGTSEVVIENVVSRATQADGINLHGKVTNALVSNVWFESTGDDTFAVWGGDQNESAVVWQDSVAINPGILRPDWYGVCVATYGLYEVAFNNITCRTPTLTNPIPDPNNSNTPSRWRADTSAFVFYGSFWASYPTGNTISLNGWHFEDLDGNRYLSTDGTMDAPSVEWDGMMTWTTSVNGVVAPFYIPDADTTGSNMPHVVAYE